MTFLSSADSLGKGAVDALIWSFTTFAVIITAVRLYTRIHIVKAFGLDDHLIICGQLVAVGLAAVTTWHVEFFLNHLLILVPLKDNQVSNTMYLSGFVTDVVYIFTLPIIKCSILAFYRRIAPSKKQRLILYFIAFFILAQAIICFMLILFAVDPAIAWLNMLGTDFIVRYNYLIIQTTNSGFQVIYDVVLLLIPLPVIIKTRFRGRERAGLIVIYIICCFSLFAAVIRLVMVIELAFHNAGVLGKQKGVSYIIWTIIEVMTAVACANMPAMSAFFRHLLRNNSRRSSLPRLSRFSNNLYQTVLKIGIHQSHHDSGNSGRPKDEDAMSHVGTSEKAKNIMMEETILNRDSETEESSRKSQNSLSQERSVDNPVDHASAGSFANFSGRILSVLPFRKSKSAVADSAAEVETASGTVERGPVIYRTDEYNVERSIV